MNNKAISGIVATVIMIALVVAIAGIVWVVVTNLVSEQLEEAGTCLEVLDKVTINSQYTCYNVSEDHLQFSIGIGDIIIEKVMVSVSWTETTESYEISQDSKKEVGITFYNGTEEIFLPDKNEGFTYVLDTSSKGRPDSIKIYPVVKGRQCDSSSSISEINSCLNY